MSNTVSTPMSALYFKAWNKLLSEKPRAMIQMIIDQPDSRVASDLAHETALLAEKWSITDDQSRSTDK